MGLWGPRARDILGSLTGDDVSKGGLGFVRLPGDRGSGGRGAGLADLLVGEWVGSSTSPGGWRRGSGGPARAGEPHGAVPVGIGVYGTTGRIEKGYRAFGFELDGERTIVEAGMQRPKVKAADFVGARPTSGSGGATGDGAVHDHRRRSHVGEWHERYMLGGEPILTRDGGVLTDGHGHHPYVTTAGSAPSLGKHVLLASAPDQATLGNQLAVSYMEELYPVRVVSVDATSPFDPTNDRIKG